MSEWSEEDSSTYRRIAEVAVPRRRDMMATLVSVVPFAAEDTFRIVEIGAGEGQLADALLECFPRATVLALDGSESMRKATVARTARFGGRVTVRPFELATVDWWDVMHGAQLVVSSLCLHHLTDAKKQFLYKAVAERLAGRGALLVADLIEPLHPSARRLAAESWDANARAQADAAGAPEQFVSFVAGRWNHHRFADPMDRPSALLHHLVWLKHAGFAAVDCFWLFAGHAVYGGFKEGGDRGVAGGIPFERAMATVEERLSGSPSESCRNGLPVGALPRAPL
jgi:tRNA (cmo5U34)-methyltransferase